MAAPMSQFEYLRVDPCAVITDAQSQLVRFVVHFGFNLTRVGMLKSVIEGFLADLCKFVGHGGTKRAWLPIHSGS